MLCSIKDLKKPEEPANQYELTPENRASLEHLFHRKIANCFFSRNTGYHMFLNEDEPNDTSSASPQREEAPRRAIVAKNLNNQTTTDMSGIERSYSIKILTSGLKLRFLYDQEKAEKAMNERKVVPPYCKTYISQGLHIYLEEESKDICFDLRNYHNITGRGWRAFIDQEVNLSLDSLVFYGKLDIIEILEEIEPVLDRSGVEAIPTVEVIHPSKINTSTFSDFLIKFKVQNLFFNPIPNTLFINWYLKQMESLHCSGSGLSFNDNWLHSSRLKRFVINDMSRFVTGSGISHFLKLWLHKVLELEYYELNATFCSPREIWPPVPICSFRRLIEGTDYILRSMFRDDFKVKLIRNDGQVMRIKVDDKRVILQLKMKAT